MIDNSKLQYPIFDDLYGYNKSLTGLDTKIKVEECELFINICLFRYYALLHNLSFESDSSLSNYTYIRNILLNRINKITFKNRYFKQLFIDFLKTDIDNFKTVISKSLLNSYLENDYFNIDHNSKLFILDFYSLLTLEIPLTNNEYDVKVFYYKFPKFYADNRQIKYLYTKIKVTNYREDNNFDRNFITANLVKPAINACNSVEQLTNVLSNFYVEMINSIKTNFESFSIYELARLFSINKDIGYLSINSINGIEFIKQSVFKLSFNDDRYLQLINKIKQYIFDQSNVENNISSEDLNINNNMNSCLFDVDNFNKIFTISLEEDDEGDSNLDTGDDNTSDDDSTDDDSGDDNTSDDDSTDDDSGDNDTSSKKVNKLKKYIKYNLELVKEDERLEDFLYKIALYRKIYNYINSIQKTNITSIKINILKDWISKWIFLTSLSETNKLIKELKLKNFK